MKKPRNRMDQVETQEHLPPLNRWPVIAEKTVQCPNCAGRDTRKESEHRAGAQIVRVRVCAACRARFQTREVV